MLVSSLFDAALHVVLNEYLLFEQELHYLPPNVKTRVAQRMGKRGLLCERNVSLVLHDDVMDLDLRECNISSQCLHQMALLCRKLVVLDLGVQQGFCRNNLNSSSFLHLFSHCQRLQVIKLDGCTLLDNPALFSLARHCSMVVSLSVSRCHLVSDKGVQAIASKCSHLQSISLSGTKVSSDGLVSIARSSCAARLKELKISHCINVTDDGIRAIVNGCPRLSIFVFHGCPQLTTRSQDSTFSINSRLKQLTWTVY